MHPHPYRGRGGKNLKVSLLRKEGSLRVKNLKGGGGGEKGAVLREGGKPVGKKLGEICHTEGGKRGPISYSCEGTCKAGDGFGGKHTDQTVAE